MPTLTVVQYVLGACAGSLVGLTLGLVGGGGSILAVPLMVYLVGISDPHIAIGTSALAVAVNAAVNLVNHARQGHVKWPCALVFTGVGLAGAFVGSTVGKAVSGQQLLTLFACLMLIVAVLTLRHRNTLEDPTVTLGRNNAFRLSTAGALTGAVSGFFGIGGGFLVVPGLIATTHMPALIAVGSSLVAVTAFGLMTAFNYARSGLVDWPLALSFIIGGAMGGIIGAWLASRLSQRRGALNVLSAMVIALTALYMLYRSALG
ncbi:sulfite exporter TauE/SafE family protein [Pseudomonas entomophila]|uniref:sulfite exporter TauE/SafE family protein n=1 Tax=Pseudomonas entomophila TaxID=312306 RepID=UPI0015E2AE77|nr:sulfite exporter TauE/SafE family protein [Pseudomonas entomophila]MBA1191029.1 sulfite exporter TauE/SafE family protein [Pseudomonas entomophila]